MTPPSGSGAPAGAVLGPLPGWTVAAVVGSLAGEWMGDRLAAASVFPVAASLLLVAVGVVLAAVWTAVSGARANASWLPISAGFLGIALVAVACSGGTLLRIATTSTGLLPTLAAHGGQESFVATVVAEPRPIATGWHVLVRVDELGGAATRERAALVRDHGAGEPPVLGSVWRGEASARPLPEGGYGGWLARQHAVVVLDPVSFVPAGAPGPLAAASEQLRDRVRRAATRHLDDPAAGLLVGFVTGDTRLLPETDRQAMQASGLSHLTAVSGSNLAIVVGGVLAAATAVRLGARGRLAAVALIVPWFAFVTRFEPSVLRAGTMVGLLVVANVRGRVRDPRHALAGAVLVLVSIDPRLAGSLGLLLSAMATAGVLVAAPVVQRRLPKRLPRRAAELAAMTIGAQIAVAPLLLVAFGEIGLATVPANLVAVPAAGIAATLAFVGTALAVVHVELGAWLFALAAPPTRVVLFAAHAFADVGGVVELERPATVVALLGGCGWVVVRRGRRAARWCAGVTAVAVVAASVPLITGRLPVTEFVVTAIDVGQGDAFLIESPGARLLVDAGSDDTAARWLRRNGRARLDLVVVTHPHLDHLGGIPEVLNDLDVDALWVSGSPTESPQAFDAFAVAAERGVPIRTVLPGEVVAVGDLLVEVLHPPAGRPYRFAGSEPNESSYVLRIHHGTRRVLVTGDVELEAQAELLKRVPERLRAEVFMVPHHGSRTTDPAFLAAIGGRVGLISVGRDNPHGHPHEATLAVLSELGVAVHRTDRDGTVTVAVPPPDPTPIPSPARLPEGPPSAPHATHRGRSFAGSPRRRAPAGSCGPVRYAVAPRRAHRSRTSGTEKEIPHGLSRPCDRNQREVRIQLR